MHSKKKYRTVIFYKDYFEKFFVIQSAKVKAKIIWTIELIEEIERVPETYLKHIESTPGLYENELPRRKQRSIKRGLIAFRYEELCSLSQHLDL